MKCRQPEKVLPLRVPVVARSSLEYFFLFSQICILKSKNLNHVYISDFGKNISLYFLSCIRIRRIVLFPCKGGSKSSGKVFNEADPM
jgi:hypothetical protein